MGSMENKLLNALISDQKSAADITNQVHIALRGVRPSLILELIPGAIKFLHCLQKFILNS